MDTFRLINLIKSEESILSQELDLSICLRTDGFFFSLIDKNYQLKAIGEFETDLSHGMTQIMTNLRNSFASIGIRLFNFSDIRVIVPSSKNIFVPFKLYDSTKSKDYLRDIAYLSTSETILENISNKLDAVSIFAMPMHNYSAVKILMPKAKYFSQHQIIAEYCFDVSKLSNNTVLLNKRENACDLVVFKGSQFVFSNCFDFSNESDLIYQILFAFEQLEMDVEDMNFLITGHDYTNDEKKVLSRHIKNVMYANPMEFLKYDPQIFNIDLQKYFLTLVK